MSVAENVILVPASERDQPLLSNLLELYVHDLSEVFPVELREDGRFGYERLPLYWSEPERRFPFLINCAGRVVGFALVTAGSPVSDDPCAHDIAEFFVLRRYRRSGVGRRAAFLLWSTHDGRWTVRVAEQNVGALRFWANAIAEYTQGAFEESRHSSSLEWRVFTFRKS